ARATCAVTTQDVDQGEWSGGLEPPERRFDSCRPDLLGCVVTAASLALTQADRVRLPAPRLGGQPLRRKFRRAGRRADSRRSEVCPWEGSAEVIRISRVRILPPLLMDEQGCAPGRAARLQPARRGFKSFHPC